MVCPTQTTTVYFTLKITCIVGLKSLSVKNFTGLRIELIKKIGIEVLGTTPGNSWWSNFVKLSV
jgi:hypothetical protein